MPRTHGHSAVSLDRVHRFVHTSRALTEHVPSEEGEVERAIGETYAAARAPIFESAAIRSLVVSTSAYFEAMSNKLTACEVADRS